MVTHNIGRGIRFHYGNKNSLVWTEGCYVLFPEYTIRENGKINIDGQSSQNAAINFAHLLGGVGYSFNRQTNRIGVSFYPYGIQDKLILKNR